MSISRAHVRSQVRRPPAAGKLTAALLTVAAVVAGHLVAAGPAAHAEEPDTLPGQLIGPIRPDSFAAARLASVRLDGTGLEYLTTGEPDAGYTVAAVGEAAASADGNVVAYIEVSSGAEGSVRRLVVLNRSTGDRTVIATVTATWVAGAYIHRAAVSRDGSQVAWVTASYTDSYSGPEQIRVADVDGGNAHTAFTAAPWSVGGLTWTPDDRLLFSQGGATDFDLWTVAPDGTALTQLTDTPSLNEVTATYSPDGTQIAVQTSWNTEGWFIRIADANGNITRTLAPGAWSTRLEWSPDGRHVAWYGPDGAGTNPGVMVGAADGSSAPSMLPTPAGGFTGYFAWVPGEEPAADTTDPQIALTAPADGARLDLGAAATLDYTCSDDVAVASCTATIDDAPAADGDPLPTSATGAHTVTVTAVDTAGNEATATATYYVEYVFSGLTGSVSSTELNTAKAGAVVPLQFRLTDADGTPVLDLTGVEVTSRPTACTALSGEGDPVEEYARGGSGLRSLGDGHYQWNWATSKSYANSCRVATLRLNTGGTATAAFQFHR